MKERSMEIVTLVENSCYDKRLMPEFGLSLLITIRDNTILFDMGASARFADNAQILEKDLAKVDCAVISHAHFDHGGGLAAFTEKNHLAPIYAGPGLDRNYYASVAAKMPLALQPLLLPVLKKSELFSRYIGIDDSVVQEVSGRIEIISGQKEILPDVFLLGNITMKYPNADGNKYLLEMSANGMRQDSFDHELIMVIREVDGLTLFTGCGHRGILNMVEAVEESFKNEKIKAVIGGFHLALQPGKPGIAGTREDIVSIAEKFKKANIEKVLTGHCTGHDACSILHEELGESFFKLTTGSRHVI
jgi:7,8-dihydropterin-6-yl-methyl-4-(beta-D-ribofuranosyl)aminobenzene 5'-phosphate synthase